MPVLHSTDLSRDIVLNVRDIECDALVEERNFTEIIIVCTDNPVHLFLILIVDEVGEDVDGVDGD